MARPGPQRAAGRRGSAADRAAFPFPLHSLSTPPAPPLRPQTNLEVLWLNNNKIERVVNLDQNPYSGSQKLDTSSLASHIDPLKDTLFIFII